MSAVTGIIKFSVEFYILGLTILPSRQDGNWPWTLQMFIDSWKQMCRGKHFSLWHMKFTSGMGSYITFVFCVNFGVGEVGVSVKSDLRSRRSRGETIER